jgi:hypothetical protein
MIDACSPSIAACGTRNPNGVVQMPGKLVLLKRGLVGLAVVLAVFAGIVAMRPNRFRVERSISIAAPPSLAFSQVNDFQKWSGWSPWEQLDPKMKKTFEGAPSGSGAVYSWDGNDSVGAGQMTIVESRPDQLIRIKLEFVRPFAGTSDTEFRFKPEGDRTLVTWGMAGDHTFLSKAICLFMDMDRNLGGDFEKGLAQIKAISEKSALSDAARADDPAIGIHR